MGLQRASRHSGLSASGRNTCGPSVDHGSAGLIETMAECAGAPVLTRKWQHRLGLADSSSAADSGKR